MTEREEKLYIKEIKKYCKPGRTVYTSCDHVSSSGMSRHINVLVGYKNGIINITWYVAKICGYKRAKDGCLSVSGCGMDMGFDVVYTLGRCLWPKGTNKPHGSRNGEPDSNGGYALKHSWI